MRQPSSSHPLHSINSYTPSDLLTSRNLPMLATKASKPPMQPTLLGKTRTIFNGLRGVDAASGEHQLLGARAAHNARQPLRAAGTAAE